MDEGKKTQDEPNKGEVRMKGKKRVGEKKTDRKRQGGGAVN